MKGVWIKPLCEPGLNHFLPYDSLNLETVCGRKFKLVRELTGPRDSQEPACPDCRFIESNNRLK